MANTLVIGSNSNLTNITPTEHKFINQIKVGDNFSGIYYLEKFFEKVAKNGNKYTDLVLRDRSGSATNIKFWGVFKTIKKGNYVRIEATGEEYQNHPQIIIKKIEVVKQPQDLTNYEIISKTKENDLLQLKEFIAEVKGLCDKIKDQTCSQVLMLIDNEEFEKSVGSILPHDGVRGGTLAHTIRTVFVAKDIANHYNLSDFENTVLLTSALIHAVGDIEAFWTKDCAPQETERGILLGRQQLSLKRLTQIVSVLTANEADIKNDTILRIMHCLISYNGTIKPMTKEAIVLNAAIRMDNEIVESFNFISQDTNDEEFTAYDPVLRRRYYKK